jgi:hypothetical protein
VLRWSEKSRRKAGHSAAPSLSAVADCIESESIAIKAPTSPILYATTGSWTSNLETKSGAIGGTGQVDSHLCNAPDARIAERKQPGVPVFRQIPVIGLLELKRWRCSVSIGLAADTAKAK